MARKMSTESENILDNVFKTTAGMNDFSMLQFLASVADRQQYKSLFEDPATLASICEKIIVPNIQVHALWYIRVFDSSPVLELKGILGCF